MVATARLTSMRFGSRILGVLAVLALGLPYATPALCDASASSPTAADGGCGNEHGDPSVTGAPSPTSCDLGDCPTAVTAPPGGDLPVLPAQPSVDMAEHELASLLLGESRAPLTPPPLV